MKSFKYDDTRKQQSEVLDYISTLSKADVTPEYIIELSPLLNKYYPKNAPPGSPIIERWKIARAHLDSLATYKGVNAIKFTIFTHPLTSAIIAGIVVAIVAICLIQPWYNRGNNTVKIGTQQETK